MYIFGHRQTHGTGFSRQGVAEKVTILPDGSIPQVEITSCGLNGGPLSAKGTYQSYIACHLTEKDLSRVGDVLNPGPHLPVPELPSEMPYITEEENGDWEKGLKPYIANLCEGCTAGFKYFTFDGSEKTIALELRGSGSIQVMLDAPNGPVAAELTHSSQNWDLSKTSLANISGTHALYLTTTDGSVDFAAFTIE